MAQIQGKISSDGGRLDGSLGTAVADSNIVLGAGWGDSTHAVTSGSTDQRGEVVITCATGGGLAQATATIVFTYASGAYAAKPWFVVTCTNDNSLTAVHEFTVSQAATTTTAATWTSQIIPVNTKVYTVRWVAIA